MTKAPERIWMDPGAEMLKGQTMSDNTDDMNDFVLLAIARDEAVSRVKELEAKLAAADKLAEAVTHEREMVCQAFGMQQDAAPAVHNALAAYQATKEGG